VLTLQEIEEAFQKSAPLVPSDSVFAHMELPFISRFYPLGFPIEISTNSEEILDAAAENWWDFKRLFDSPLIRIQAAVLEGGSGECPPAPVCRVREHLFSFVADQENYGVNDMARGFSNLWLNADAVRHRNYLRYFFLECAAIPQIATRYATGVHAACVSRDGVGILLCGDSGAGKTTLSYACAKAGWTYITDDGSFLVHGRDDLLVTGNCHQVRFRPSAESFFPEIQGLPVVQRSDLTKPSIELSSSLSAGLRRSQVANVEFVVFLNRREEKNDPLRPYSKKVARHFFSQGRFSPPDMMHLHNIAIDRLLQQEVLELRYRDLDWAIEQLNKLAAVNRL
jgi:hypothetical protein